MSDVDLNKDGRAMHERGDLLIKDPLLATLNAVTAPLGFGFQCDYDTNGFVMWWNGMQLGVVSRGAARDAFLPWMDDATITHPPLPADLAHRITRARRRGLS